MLVKVKVNFLLLNLGLSLCDVLGSLLKVLCVYRKHKGGHTPDVIRQRGAIFHFSKENKSRKIANNTGQVENLLDHDRESNLRPLVCQFATTSKRRKCFDCINPFLQIYCSVPHLWSLDMCRLLRLLLLTVSIFR